MRMLCALPGITELLTVSISLQGVYRHKAGKPHGVALPGRTADALVILPAVSFLPKALMQDDSYPKPISAI